MKFTDIISLQWMYPNNISRQETINRFLIFAVAVQLVCIGMLTLAFVVQRQEILDRRAKADAHSQQWKKAMDDYEKAKQRGTQDDQARQRGTKGTETTSIGQYESTSSTKDRPRGGKR